MGLVVSRETQHMGVPYYVDKRFEKEYHGAALDELEKAIESDYIEYLQNSCWKEKQQSKPASPLSRLGRPPSILAPLLSPCMHTVHHHYTFSWGQVSTGCLATATMRDDLYRMPKEMCVLMSRGFGR